MSKLRTTILPFENLWKFAFQPLGFRYCFLKGLEPKEDVFISDNSLKIVLVSPLLTVRRKWSVQAAACDIALVTIALEYCYIFRHICSIHPCVCVCACTHTHTYICMYVCISDYLYPFCLSVCCPIWCRALCQKDSNIPRTYEIISQLKKGNDFCPSHL